MIERDRRGHIRLPNKNLHCIKQFKAYFHSWDTVSQLCRIRLMSKDFLFNSADLFLF